MFNRLLLPIGMLLNIAPYAFLCYSSFMDMLLISKKKLIILLCFFSIAQFGFYFYYSSMSFALMQISFFSWLALYCLVYFLTVKINFSKKLFVFLLIANYAGLIVGCSNSFHIHFFAQHATAEGYNLTLLIIRLVMLMVTIFVFRNVMEKKVRPLIIMNHSPVWTTLWLIPLLFLLALIVFSGAKRDNLIESWQYTSLNLLVLMGVHLVYYVVLKMINEVDQNATLRENVRMVNVQLALQEDVYKGLSEHIAETRAARHDLRHHLAVIEYALQTDDKEYLLNYVKQYKSALPDDRELTVCENHAVNVIVLHYLELAKAEGISTSISLHLPQNIGIADSDLCIIFGNCLENALEACKKTKSEQKYIHIKSGLQRKMLGITIDNSFDGTVEEKDGVFYSLKRNHEEGVGMSSIRAVTTKYRGATFFAFDDHEFQVSIILNTQNTKSNLGRVGESVIK